MKRLFFLAACMAAAIVQSGAHPAAAQQRGPEVVIIDLPYIFKNHIRFKALMDELRADADQAEKDVKAANESLKSLAERLDDYNRGSEEYKSLQVEYAKRQADLSVQIKVQKRDFLEQEARNYYSVYQEVYQRVQQYAENNGINLVLQFNGDPLEQVDAPGVQSQLNKMVFYHNPAPQIDITPIILDQLNNSSPRRQAPAGGQTSKSRQTLPPKR